MGNTVLGIVWFERRKKQVTVPIFSHFLTLLGGLLVLLSFPAALVLGIVGIVLDNGKLLAIITTIVAAGCVFFYLFSRVFLL